ncbi:MAG: hypothetical protein HKN91_10235, partial [Acidimicrobiia bacterium]|nr:hypothetical protein [Acidimicrobiia bacterium]
MTDRGVVAECHSDDQVEGADRERGATLVLAAAVLIVLMGMAGFAVDLG